jgi:hypothetical protein
MFGISYIFHPFEIIDIFMLLKLEIMESGASGIPSESNLTHTSIHFIVEESSRTCPMHE